jgi:hypothetical protein
MTGNAIGPGLIGIPSLEVFNSWGFSWADVVPANDADNLLSEKFQLPKRKTWQLSSPY